jgi:predicted enzyme related to lactoylglutathione lyase
MASFRLFAVSLFIAAGVCYGAQAGAPETTGPAVGTQYDTTHIYLAPADVSRFVTSFLATFGGTSTKQFVVTVTPTPSLTSSQLLLTPVGSLSVFGFRTPVPYPFGLERTGFLVRDIDAAVADARSHGAALLVATFPDPIGRDAVIQWPGGVNMQLYWHTKPPSYPRLQTVPENRVYVSPDEADAFVRDFDSFAQGKVVADDRHAPGAEIGRPGDTYRRIHLTSPFGRITVLVTDGHLPYPYGHEVTGYEVGDVPATIAKAQSNGAHLLTGPYPVDGGQAAILDFPGGYIAEIHSYAS